jgi:hypothetical protein
VPRKPQAGVARPEQQAPLLVGSGWPATQHKSRKQSDVYAS